MSRRRVLTVIFTCGMANLTACNTTTKNGSDMKVTGGEIVSVSQRPVAKVIAKNAVTLQVPGGHCTGALIAPRLVITAGHCIKHPNGIKVFFPNATSTGQTSQIIEPNNVLIHKDFNQDAPDHSPTHDLALLFLSSAAPSPYIPVPIISGNAIVKAIELRDGNVLTRGQLAFIAGSGRTTRNGASDQQMRFAEVEAYVGLQDEHATVYSSPTVAGCPGDSGGPVYIPKGDGLVLAAVMSMANCDKTNEFVTLAIDLKAYVDTWITVFADGQVISKSNVDYNPSATVRDPIDIKKVISFFRPSSVPVHPTDPDSGDQPLRCKDETGSERVLIYSSPLKVEVIGGSFSGTYTKATKETNAAYSTFQLTEQLEFRINLASAKGVLGFRTASGQLIRDISTTCK